MEMTNNQSRPYFVLVLCFVLITPGPSLAQLPGYGEADQASYSEAAAASAPVPALMLISLIFYWDSPYWSDTAITI